MCGIVGYIGNGDIKSILFDGLKRVAYRGYDSSGAIILGSKKPLLVRSIGKIDELIKTFSDAKQGVILYNTHVLSSPIFFDYHINVIPTKEFNFALEKIIKQQDLTEEEKRLQERLDKIKEEKKKRAEK